MANQQTVEDIVSDVLRGEFHLYLPRTRIRKIVERYFPSIEIDTDYQPKAHYLDYQTIKVVYGDDGLQGGYGGTDSVEPETAANAQ